MVYHPPYDDFIRSHRMQLETSSVPIHFWPSVYEKIVNEIFDAGDVFTLLQIDYEGKREAQDPVWQVQVQSEINHTDAQHVYLIDHAWTFRVTNAKKQLLEVDTLRKRMCFIMGLDEADKESTSEKIFKEMWRYCNSYSIANTSNVEDRMPVWYVMDELGSGIQHSDDPNFRLVPFINVFNQMTYSLLFPTRNVEQDDIVTRDFVENIKDPQERAVLLLPWIYKSYLDRSYEHIKVSVDYFLSGHIKETLPDIQQNLDIKKNKLKVFAEYNYVRQYLTHNQFEIVDNEEEADILWYTKHFKNFKEFSANPERFINQFPFEYVLTIKDLLSIICRRDLSQSHKSSPDWLPITYNLKTELIQFVSYYQNREEHDQDNYWIMKPFNLARGLDTHITNNLNYILRLPATGPKIAQKYIQNPILFLRPECSGKVKFDVRYVLLLKSIKPLQAYVYKQFFLRFANFPFALNNFDRYEQHFTVMNYEDTAELKHMLCEDFKKEWLIQYPQFNWEDIEKDILTMLREVLMCASAEDPPCGIGHNPQSRALYAADIMLEWKDDERAIQPKLLEVNWTPDCKRACEYYPDFYNDIFKLLFLEIENEKVFHQL